MKKTIKDALEYIHCTSKFGSVLGLDKITRLLELMENPQDKLKFIHLAGTNGKGSTSAYMAKILEKAGYSIGLFTSPYIEIFNERIRINEEYISDDDLAEITFVVKRKVDIMLEEGFDHPTEFEVVTAMAIEYFLRKKVDYVILEVGLGGRYDSTNGISKSLVSVITPIGIDHIEVLGENIAEIAYEKAGIIKKDGLVVSYPQEKDAKDVLEKVSREEKAELIEVPLKNVEILKLGIDGCKFNFKYGKYELKDLKIKMIGEYQVFNASTAITALLTLKDKKEIELTEENIRLGLLDTRWMGRLELMRENPRVLIDGAHNIQGIKALKKAIEELFEYDKLILGIGILADKDVDDIVAEIAPLGDTIVVTEPDIFRALEAEKLGEKIKNINPNTIIEKNIGKAVEKAISMAGKNDLVIFLGSLYLIGDIRKHLNKRI